MATMKRAHSVMCEIGGVDPSIIHELSGIYKPFAKAFKELVSNAYDADADLVHINVAADSDEIEIKDDGIGMTPFDFRSEFTKLGGSHKRSDRSSTRKGRQKIGSKGIGFLAVARYCSAMEVVSSTRRSHSGTIHQKGGLTTYSLPNRLEVPIPAQLLSDRLRVRSVILTRGTKKLLLKPTDFTVRANGTLEILKKKQAAHLSDSVEINYVLDCKTLEFKARIDYDYLLSLENKKDLAQISDFCEIQVHALPPNDPRIGKQYTHIRLKQLKDFVIRDLRATKRPGRVRNIESESGIDRFLWHLSRCTPLKYDIPALIEDRVRCLCSPEIKSIDRLLISLGIKDEVELRRPLWHVAQTSDHNPLVDDVWSPIRIDEGHFRAEGYVWGHREAIFPAEYRGLAVRVRNVQIGSPGFFGLEHTLTGAARALLSQITGEINVFTGLDATDALNPGRDSFYEENLHYKILRGHVVGSGEATGGILGDLIGQMIERLQVVSAAESNVTKANHFRSALLNLSLAINHYGSNSNGLIDLKRLFRDQLKANGLSERQDYDVLPGPRVAGFHVKAHSHLEKEQMVDYEEKTVYFNFQHDRWSNRIFVLGHHYDVIRKLGTNSDPLCEIDTGQKKVFLNWGHSLRGQMGDLPFLKSAIAWKLSYHACQGNIEAMMDLAFNLLSFNGA